MLFPAGAVGSAEVRGGAPATRETRPARSGAHRRARRRDRAVAGGSAFGLAAADGVMRYLAERGQGYPTAGGPVPIVPAACIFDLVEASGPPPGADDGYAAAVAAARDEPLATGRVGARPRVRPSASGAGASAAVPGGVGVAHDDGRRRARSARSPWSTRSATSSPPTARRSPGRPRRPAPGFPDARSRSRRTRANTTLVVVVTDAALDKVECLLLAQSAHDGLARALHPRTRASTATSRSRSRPARPLRGRAEPRSPARRGRRRGRRGRFATSRSGPLACRVSSLGVP